MEAIKEKYRSRLLELKEISERTHMPVDSLRYKRHQGELPFLFRVGRRLVCYEDELDAWIAEQRRLTSRSR